MRKLHKKIYISKRKNSENVKPNQQKLHFMSNACKPANMFIMVTYSCTENTF